MLPPPTPGWRPVRPLGLVCRPLGLSDAAGTFLFLLSAPSCVHRRAEPEADNNAWASGSTVIFSAVVRVVTVPSKRPYNPAIGRD